MRGCLNIYEGFIGWNFNLCPLVQDDVTVKDIHGAFLVIPPLAQTELMQICSTEVTDQKPFMVNN